MLILKGLREKRAIPMKKASKDAGPAKPAGEQTAHLPVNYYTPEAYSVKGKAREKLVLKTRRGGAIIGALDTLVDIGAPAEKEVIQ
jgi:hypothetical protein